MVRDMARPTDKDHLLLRQLKVVSAKTTGLFPLCVAADGTLGSENWWSQSKHDHGEEGSVQISNRN